MTQSHSPTLPNYSPLSDEQRAYMADMRAMEERVLRQLDLLRTLPSIDQRWLQIGRTHVEQAYMAINRAIAQPSRLEIPDAVR